MKANKPTQEDIDQLKRWIEANNFTVYTVIRHVSKSGMMREISVVIPIIKQTTYDNSGDTPKLVYLHVQQFVHPSYTIAGLLNRSYSEKNGHNSVVCHGCGMDMGFDLVYHLSSVLYGDGYKITWKKNRDSTKVDHEEALRDIVSKYDLPPAEISAIIQARTTIKAGARVFRSHFDEEEQ